MFRKLTLTILTSAILIVISHQVKATISQTHAISFATSYDPKSRLCAGKSPDQTLGVVANDSSLNYHRAQAIHARSYKKESKNIPGKSDQMAYLQEQKDLQLKRKDHIEESSPVLGALSVNRNMVAVNTLEGAVVLRRLLKGCLTHLKANSQVIYTQIKNQPSMPLDGATFTDDFQYDEMRNLQGINLNDYGPNNTEDSFNSLREKILESSKSAAFDTSDKVLPRNNRLRLSCALAMDAANKQIRQTVYNNRISHLSTEQTLARFRMATSSIVLVEQACAEPVKRRIVIKPSSIRACKLWKNNMTFYSQSCNDGPTRQPKTGVAHYDKALIVTGNLYHQTYEDKRSSIFERPYEQVMKSRNSENLDNENTANLKTSQQRLQMIVDSYYNNLPIHKKISFTLSNIGAKVASKIAGFATTAYARANRMIRSFAPTSGHFPCSLGRTSAGEKCIDYEEASKFWGVPSRTTAEDEEIYSLIAELGEEFQIRKGLSPSATDLVEQLSTYREYSKERRKIAEREYSIEFFGEPDAFSIYSGMDYIQFSTKLQQELKAAGLNSIEFKNLDKEALGKIKAKFIKKQKSTRKKRKLASYSKSAKKTSTQVELSGPDVIPDVDFDTGDNLIHKNQHISIFKIISRRYIQKMFK